jgi:hypothetical protein
MIRRLAACVLLCGLATAAAAQNTVPTPDEFLGYKLGERFTRYDRILAYFDELTRHSNLITVSRMGETYEGRPLVLAAITSAKNRAALETIRADVGALAGGAADAARAASIAKNSPAIVWLGFGIHGNESSSSEAAMRVASTLLRDPDAQRILDDVVVLIDPLQNPDGRERYVQWFNEARGAQASMNPDAFEHAEPWPGGRNNHYLIDMNRDWPWTSQQETRARVAEYHRWNPQVFVDFHEMRAQSSYFFPPDAKPINVNLPPNVEKWLATFGRANAEAFSQRGWPFFVAETFDLFYPGYGDSWPSLHGAIGMTYEVAGGGDAGSAFRREDGTTLSLAHRIDEHYTTAMATVRTAAAHHEELLRYTYDAARAQIDGGKNTYFVVPAAPNFRALVAALQRQNIEVAMLNAPLTARVTPIGGSTAESRTLPAGTAVVTTKQATGRIVETLLERSAAFSKGYVEEQRTRIESDQPDEFYDLTAWSMPLAYNVDTYVTNAPVQAELKTWEKPARAPFRTASYGYVVDGNDGNVYRFAGALLTARVNFNVNEEAITFGDRTFARGSVVVLKGNNKEDLDAAIDRIALQAEVAVVPVDSGWSGGTGLGSESIHYVKDPEIALVGGDGVDASSFGMLWHTLDVDTPIPHTVIALSSLRNVNLGHYRVLVLPDGDGYMDRLGKRGVEKLQSWIRDGGTLVAIKGASRFLRDKDVEISKLKTWEPPKKKDDDPTAKKTDERYNEYRIPGSALRTSMNERSYLTFGIPKAPAVLIEGTTSYQPVSHRVDNIVTIDAKDPLVSGVAWPESLERLKGGAYVVTEPYGKGNVITFADEPHFRLFWRGTLPLFLNAVLYSPSFPR